MSPAGDNDELGDDGQAIFRLVERCEIGGQPLGQHRKDDAWRVDRRRVVRGMPIDRRTLRHRRIDVRDRHEDSDVSARQRLGDRQLVEIAGIVVVDRAPRQRAQVARRRLGRARRPRQRRHLGELGRREIGIETASAHRLDGNRAQPCAMGSGVGHEFRMASIDAARSSTSASIWG